MRFSHATYTRRFQAYGPTIPTWSHIVHPKYCRNWGLTEHELTTIPPSLVRCFSKGSRGGIGAPLPGDFGRLLMRGEYNTQLYGPLQTMYEEGKRAGTDIWIHKNR